MAAQMVVDWAVLKAVQMVARTVVDWEVQMVVQSEWMLEEWKAAPMMA